MTKDTFWSIIDESRTPVAECDEIVAAIAERLKSLSPESILAFRQHLNERRAESYRWDLWAVAYIINGGCSDDGFEYFRGWLIAQGRQYFEAALAQAERAADKTDPDRDDYECEEMLGAGLDVYEERVGQPMPDTKVRFPSEPAGTPWEEDQLEKLYPELCERYGF